MKLVASEPINRKKLSDHIEERLLFEIQSGIWLPGDILPSERELMEKYQTGRPAVREAMQKLQGRSLIEIRHGERPRVAKPRLDNMFSSLSESMHHILANAEGSLEYLLELREILEMQMTRIAADSRDPDQVARLHEIIRCQELALDDPETFMDRDGDFHMEIARASRNPICVTLCQAMFTWLRAFHIQWVRREGMSKLTLAEHRVVLRMIEDGDPEAAALAMKSHLNRANSQYARTGMQPGVGSGTRAEVEASESDVNE